MADKYVFRLNSGGLEIIVIDEIGPFNTWSSTPNGNCLVAESGIVVERNEGFVCGAGHSGNQTILMLLGASWDSQVGDEGKVTNVLASGCNPTAWELVDRS